MERGGSISLWIGQSGAWLEASFAFSGASPHKDEGGSRRLWQKQGSFPAGESARSETICKIFLLLLTDFWPLPFTLPP